MSLGYILKLSLKVYLTNFEAQKIDDFTFKTFKIVPAKVQVEKKLEKICFFQETFLLTNISMEVVLRMLFVTFSNAKI